MFRLKVTILLGCLLLAAPTIAQVNLEGEWAGRYHEDQGDRVPGDVQGDFSGVPLNDAARRYAESFDVTRVNLIEHQCQPYSLPHIFRGPMQFRIWNEKDPAYVNSEEFVLMERGNQYWLYNCEYANEVPKPKNDVPHFLPGKNPFIKDFSNKFGLPFDAVIAGAESTYPEYMRNIEAGSFAAASRNNAAADVKTPTQASQGEIKTFHVQGNMYMLAGAGANVAVQIGDEGVVVVDTGGAQMRGKVLAAIRQLSTKPIRWIINTHPDADHTGGNETVSQAGMTVNGNPAAIVANEKVLAHMSAAGRPSTEWPLNTFFEDARDFYFNGEAILLYHTPRGHTDGDVFVYFRSSDVLVAGDVFLTTTYPVIDAKLGGGVDGFINALNKMLDIAVPKYLQEGGTYVIPGHGRVGDEADILEYRDMIVIIRDRIQDMIRRGMTPDQVKAARPTLDYDGRYGNPAAFIDALYRDLSQKK